MTISPAPLTVAPERFITSIPADLGYWPGSSLVIAFFGAASQHVLTARCDLGDVMADADCWTERLAGIARRSGGTKGLVLVYDPIAAQHWDAAALATQALVDADVTLWDAFVVTAEAGGLAWGSALHATTRSDSEAWVRLDAEQAQALLAERGESWRASRLDLVAELAPLTCGTQPVHQPALLTEAEIDSAILLTTSQLRSADVCADGYPAIAAALTDVRVRDTVVWEILRRPVAEWRIAADHLVSIVRAARADLAAPAATVLGLLRWQLGDGTRAAIAIESALTHDSEYRLAHLIMGCLASGMPPATWREGLHGLDREECRRPG